MVGFELNRVFNLLQLFSSPLLAGNLTAEQVGQLVTLHHFPFLAAMSWSNRSLFSSTQPTT